jgi:hypothetical protein
MYKPQSREDIFKQKTLPDEFRVSVTGKRMKAQKNKKEKTKDKENNKSKTENNGKQP